MLKSAVFISEILTYISIFNAFIFKSSLMIRYLYVINNTLKIALRSFNQFEVINKFNFSVVSVLVIQDFLSIMQGTPGPLFKGWITLSS